ncbi:hypothetical protein [Maribacter sp. 2-571]|uniref:hypothetical protein n=1 Tax=Maribacter sp. 2-571 TaxID=3417569 RepID=UPI003D324AC4
MIAKNKGILQRSANANTEPSVAEIKRYEVDPPYIETKLVLQAQNIRKTGEKKCDRLAVVTIENNVTASFRKR